MTDLDTLARAATQELLERSSTLDVRSRYADLRRTRARRTTLKLAAVGAAAAVAIGGWQLAGAPERTVQPTPQPGTARNGVLLALPAAGVGAGATWRTLLGTPPQHLPEDGALFAQYQFTADGTEIVYADRRARISAVELSTGRSRALVDCPDDICAASVSPDLDLVASSDGDGVWLQTVGSGERHGVARSDVGATGAPAWSPDGRSLAFVGGDGVYVARLESGSVRRVADALDPVGPVSWSPDGETLAYFAGLPVRRRGNDETVFTVELVDLASGRTTSLLDAGQCGCLGVAAPTLAWAPDGRTLAVAVTRAAALPQGVYLVPVDGGEPERVASGSYAALAWQPLRG